MRAAFLLLILSAALSPLQSAQAAFGAVEGTVTYDNELGGYCLSSQVDCTGTAYPSSEFSGQLGLPETKIDVRVYDYSAGTSIYDTSTWPVAGTGYTDEDGHFQILWYIPVNATHVFASIWWVGEHKDGRFRILETGTADQTRERPWSQTYFVILDGELVDLGEIAESGYPEYFSNAYASAHRAWESLSDSNLLVANMDDVKIEVGWPTDVYSYAQPCGSAAACYDVDRNSIQFGPTGIGSVRLPTRVYDPHFGMYHEFGHAASHAASVGNEYSFCWAYTYGGGVTNSWSYDSPEHACAGFEEGLAQFIGNRVQYRQWAPQPLDCTTHACGASDFDVEESTLAVGQSCATDEGRWMLSTQRALRDMYDSTQDYSWDDWAVPFHSIIYAISYFGNHSGNRGKNEPLPFNSNGFPTDPDGRSAVDFRTLFEANSPYASGSAAGLFYVNCSPPGD